LEAKTNEGRIYLSGQRQRNPQLHQRNAQLLHRDTALTPPQTAPGIAQVVVLWELAVNQMRDYVESKTYQQQAEVAHLVQNPSHIKGLSIVTKESPQKTVI